MDSRSFAVEVGGCKERFKGNGYFQGGYKEGGFEQIGMELERAQLCWTQVA